MPAFSSWVCTECLNVPSMIRGDSFTAVSRKASSLLYGAYSLARHKVKKSNNLVSILNRMIKLRVLGEARIRKSFSDKVTPEL